MSPRLISVIIKDRQFVYCGSLTSGQLFRALSRLPQDTAFPFITRRARPHQGEAENRNIEIIESDVITNSNNHMLLICRGKVRSEFDQIGLLLFCRQIGYSISLKLSRFCSESSYRLPRFDT